MNATEYIESGMETVKGWFYKPDAYAMVAVDKIQKELGISGGLLEIGVYRGKSLGLLAILAQSHEQVTGLDIFTLGQSDMIASQEAVQIATGDAGRAKLIKVDTQNIGIVTYGPSMALRMLHIDGAHDYKSVINDLTGFSNDCARGGVVIMDDYHQRDDPGVAIATVDFCMRGIFTPFLSSFNKMFLCHRTMAIVYVARLIADYEATMRVDNISGYPLLTLDTKKPMSQEQCREAVRQCGI